jgi:hypothetical protein
MVRGCPPAGQTWKTFLRNRDRRDGSARSADGRFQAALCVRAWTRIAGVSSQPRSHPIPPPNGLRGRWPKPFPGKRPRKYLLRDRDAVYGHVVRHRLAAMGIGGRPITARRLGKTDISNAPSARFRRDCINHVIVLGEGHLRKILKLYADNHRMRVLAPPSRPREDLVPRRGTLGKNRFRR